MSTGSRSNDFTASVKISDLSSETKYVYRFYAYNHTSGKTISGDLKSFKTLSGSSNSSSVQSSSSSVSSGVSSSSSSVQQYTLNVKISGGGKITSSGGSGVIECLRKIDSKGKGATSGDCSVKFNEGESVTLTPSTPSTKYEFATWADDCRSAQKVTSCAIIMSGNKTVSATFNKKGAGGDSADVSVRKTGEGVGKVVSIYYTGKNSGKEDGKINCGSDCSENYLKNCNDYGYGSDRCALVYFKAVPEKGSTFGGWGGDCLTFKNVKDKCYVHLDRNKTVNARFDEGSNDTTGKYRDLNVTVSEGGVVKSADNKNNCGSGNSNCEYSYKKNGTVTLTATPNSGYVYAGGDNVCLGNDTRNKGIRTCKVKMTK